MSNINSSQVISADVFIVTETVFESRESALERLESPVPALSGAVSSKLLVTAGGCNQLLQVLKKIESGDIS